MTMIIRQKSVAIKIIQRLQSEGFTAYLAGGCVRDQLLGREPKDYDVATDARPHVVESLFSRTIPIGRAFGVVAVVDDKTTVEVATFRSDVGAPDGRHPDSVVFCTPEEDALRRDFTINGMFYDPIQEQLHDFVNGQQDLDRRIITAIGNPAERFAEDYLRMLRAVRFTHTLEFTLEETTSEAIKALAHDIKRISAERIEMELSRMLTESKRPGEALLHLHELGLLKIILPECIPDDTAPDGSDAAGPLFMHTAEMLNQGLGASLDEKAPALITPEPSRKEIAYALLLHAMESADAARDVLTRLRLPTREIQRISNAVSAWKDLRQAECLPRAALRRRLGAPSFPLQYVILHADELSANQTDPGRAFIDGFLEEMKGSEMLPPSLIGGEDLQALGLAPGPRIGAILEEVYDLQLEERFNSREELLVWIRKNYASEHS